MTPPQRVFFIDDLNATLPGILAQLSSRRALVVCDPSRRFVDDVLAAIPKDTATEVFAGAQVHVPTSVVKAASQALTDSRADTVISLGGGSATGLGKALRLSHDVRFIALPTTYAGSERTTIWGMTEAKNKQTGRDERVLPDVVLYLPSFTLGLPLKISAQSLLNAMSHPMSALSADSLAGDVREQALTAIGQVVRALEAVLAAPKDVEARRCALEATALAGAILDAGEVGVHHKIAHFLGGRFNLDHAALHSILLPQSLKALDDSQPSLYREIEAVAGAGLPGRLFDGLSAAGAPTSLEALGVESAAVRTALDDRPELPRGPIERALVGERPSR